jgi:hypothetical protein
LTFQAQKTVEIPTLSWYNEITVGAYAMNVRCEILEGMRMNEVAKKFVYKAAAHLLATGEGGIDLPEFDQYVEWAWEGWPEGECALIDTMCFGQSVREGFYSLVNAENVARGGVYVAFGESADEGYAGIKYGDADDEGLMSAGDKKFWTVGQNATKHGLWSPEENERIFETLRVLEGKLL